MSGCFWCRRDDAVDALSETGTYICHRVLHSWMMIGPPQLASLQFVGFAALSWPAATHLFLHVRRILPTAASSDLTAVCMQLQTRPAATIHAQRSPQDVSVGSGHRRITQAKMRGLGTDCRSVCASAYPLCPRGKRMKSRGGVDRLPGDERRAPRCRDKPCSLLDAGREESNR